MKKSIFKTVLILFSIALFSGCNVDTYMKTILNKMVPKEDDKFAREYLETIKKNDIGGAGLFFLKKWGRILSIVGAIFLFLTLLYTMFGLIIDYLIKGYFEGILMYIIYSIMYAGASYIAPFVLFYLTRSKIKEQFK